MTSVLAFVETSVSVLCQILESLDSLWYEATPRRSRDLTGGDFCVSSRLTRPALLSLLCFARALILLVTLLQIPESHSASGLVKSWTRGSLKLKVFNFGHFGRDRHIKISSNSTYTVLPTDYKPSVRSRCERKERARLISIYPAAILIEQTPKADFKRYG